MVNFAKIGDIGSFLSTSQIFIISINTYTVTEEKNHPKGGINISVFIKSRTKKRTNSLIFLLKVKKINETKK